MVALAEDTREARRGISSFLALHEGCGAELDIRRTSGPGPARLSLLCKGCGARAECDGTDPGTVATLGAAPQNGKGANGNGNRIWSGDGGGGGGKDGRGGSKAEAAARWLPVPPTLPAWVPSAYIVAVIALGLALIAFGVFRPSGSAGGEAPPSMIARPPAPQAAPAPPPATPPPAERPPEVELDRASVLDRFALGIPRGWAAADGYAALTLRAPGDDARIQVFLESGAADPERLAGEASEFLADQHPGARITSPAPLQLGRASALQLVAWYNGATQRAVVFSRGGFSYLVVTTLEDGASPRTQRQALAALRSLRAR